MVMGWRNVDDGEPWRPKRRTVGLFAMYQRAPSALWEWVTDDRGERVRFRRDATPAEVIARLGARAGAAYQVIPFGRDGAQSQDPPEWIPASGDQPHCNAHGAW